MNKEEIKQLKEELESVKKKLRISEQDVFRLAAEKIDLQDTIKKLNQNKEELTLTERYNAYGIFAPKGDEEHYTEEQQHLLLDGLVPRLRGELTEEQMNLLNQNKDEQRTELRR